MAPNALNRSKPRSCSKRVGARNLKVTGHACLPYITTASTELARACSSGTEHLLLLGTPASSLAVGVLVLTTMLPPFTFWHSSDCLVDVTHEEPPNHLAWRHEGDDKEYKVTARDAACFGSGEWIGEWIKVTRSCKGNTRGQQPGILAEWVMVMHTHIASGICSH
eukprot:scaffold173008_cov17-Tisochrysis_lutea.AAC.1